jgi:hypothetical protein
MDNKDNEHLNLGKELADYCIKYSIPLEYFFEIANDQKVVPMLRGKGMEYNVYLLLKQILNQREWIVTKLNLSAQPGILDKDISITHRRTEIELIVESKSIILPINWFSRRFSATRNWTEWLE